MKIKPGFNIRQMCGENIIVGEGEQNIDFSSIVSLNESAAYLWQKLQPLDSFTVDDMVRLIMDEYEVDEATATDDCTTLAATWGGAALISGDDIPALPASAMPAAAPEPVAETPAPQPKKRGLFARLFGK